jgi:hypothetical protein
MADTRVNINLDGRGDELLDEMEEEEDTTKRGGRLRSAINKRDDTGRKAKGRGFSANDDSDERYSGSAGKFDALEDENTTGPLKCKENVYLYCLIGL